MKKFRFLLLDAGPIIKLFELGLWDDFISKCDVTICRTVAEDELVFAETDKGKEYIEHGLKSDEEKSLIKIIDIGLSVVKTFRESIPVFYDIHEGEEETLAFLFNSTEEWKVCAADKAVFKILGYFNRMEQGISLEEVFRKVGYSKELEWKYTKKFREQYTREGQVDAIQR